MKDCVFVCTDLNAGMYERCTGYTLDNGCKKVVEIPLFAFPFCSLASLYFRQDFAEGNSQSIRWN